ncbi:ABC transporter permease [Prevotella sp. 10(H)]|uniref:ABC transporter permease n=1 Tax=Prevotella sp. 10(H) TaxID=1158294 RepID=UPI0004A72A2C|nr:ABC transporter permease [Prevotella sp. 10(H)]
MYKTYFKQAIEILKLNKFVSIITIIGTALAIMMIMVLIVTDSIKNISIAPENNRDRTLYIKDLSKKGKKEERAWNGGVSYADYKNYLSELKSPEYTVVIDNTWNGGNFMVKENEGNQRFMTNTKMTNADFWKVMSFSFIEGRPFTQEEFDSGILNAVISEKTAKKIYGNTSPIGKNIEIDFKDYKVIGVVKDVPETFGYAYSEIYIPYTSKPGYQNRYYRLLFLMKNKEDFPMLDEEFREAERKFNAIDTEWNLTLRGPYTHQQQQIAVYSNVDPDYGKATRKTIFIISILLLIPAVNLSSFSMSRIKKRTEEIGIRKAFGAKKYIILIQVIYENLITSLIGGIIGLILSYVVVIWLKEWLLGIGAESGIPLSALVSIPVFIGVFVVCFLLNLLSAGLPAYRASATKIVDSLNQKNA